MRSGYYGNMKRHLKKLHPDEYRKECGIIKHTDAKPKYVEKYIVEDNNDNEHDDDSHSDSIVEDDYEDKEYSISKQPEDVDKNMEDVEKKIIELCNKPVTLNNRNRTTCMWNFFNKYDGHNLYICILCSITLRIDGRNFSNLRRHYMKRHSEEYKIILKNAPPGDSLHPSTKRRSYSHSENEESEELTDETIKKIKDLCNKYIKGKYVSKTCLWNFFIQIRPKIFKCTFCNRKITISEKLVGNLRRHMRNIHWKEYDAIVKYAPQSDSIHRAGTYKFMNNVVLSSVSDAPSGSIEFDKAYFDQAEDGLYKCKKCDERIECESDDKSMLFQHIQEKHPDQVVMYQEQTTSNEDFSVFIVKK